MFVRSRRYVDNLSTPTCSHELSAALKNTVSELDNGQTKMAAFFIHKVLLGCVAIPKLLWIKAKWGCDCLADHWHIPENSKNNSDNSSGIPLCWPECATISPWVVAEYGCQSTPCMEGVVIVPDLITPVEAAVPSGSAEQCSLLTTLSLDDSWESEVWSHRHCRHHQRQHTCYPTVSSSQSVVTHHCHHHHHHDHEVAVKKEDAEKKQSAKAELHTQHTKAMSCECRRRRNHKEPKQKNSSGLFTTKKAPVPSEPFQTLGLRALGSAQLWFLHLWGVWFSI